MLNGSGTLDLMNVGAIKGVETLVLDNSQTVTLDTQTVFEMTDPNNTLIIRVDGTGNTLDETGFTDSGDNVYFDGNSYNVWEGQAGGTAVTLLVEDVSVGVLAVV